MALTLQQRLAKLAQKKQRVKQKKRPLTRLSCIVLLIILGAAIIMIVELAKVGRFTIISYSSVLAIFSVSGIVCAALMFFWRPRQSLTAFVFGGWLVYSIFLWANQYFAYEKPVVVSRPILKKWYGGKSGPYADIRYEGVDHTLHPDSRQILENSDRVVLTVVPGYFGYPCIKGVKFVKE